MLPISDAPGYQEVLAFVCCPGCCYPGRLPFKSSTATLIRVAPAAAGRRLCIAGLLLARCGFASVLDPSK
jgi:hypothetical protein